MSGRLVQDYDCTACGAGITVAPREHVHVTCVCGAAAWKWIRTRTETFIPKIYGRSAALDVHVSAERIAPIGGGVRVDSLRDIRRIERESEQRERDGEGQAVRFRCYSQDNRQDNSFGPPPSQAAPSFTRPDGRERFRIAAKDAEAIEDTPLGPGVTEDTMADALAGMKD